MTDEQSKEKKCDLCLMLSQYRGVNSSYDAKVGLKRGFAFSGRVDDPYVGPGSAFHDKQVRVEICSPPDTEILEKIRANYMGGAGKPCGFVRIRAGVEPERFELDGEEAEAEPIEANLHLSPDAFEAIRRQAAEAYDHRRIIGATITLVGDALSATINPESLRPMSVPIKNLDISADKVYGVRGLEIFDTRYFDHLRGRVLEVDRGRGEGHRAYIRILITEARYEVNVARGYIHSFSCEGRVINASGRPYDGANVTVEFRKHQPNRHGELPEKGLFGEFGYYQKQPDEGYSSTHFAFSLLHVPGDDRDLLIPLLSQEAGTHVVLTVTLTIEDEELLAATNGLEGKVRYYSFEVRRNLIKA